MMGEPDRVPAGRVELRQVPLALVRVLADPEADDPGSQSWAPGYPLPGTRVAARNLLRQAEAAGDTSRWACSRSSCADIRSDRRHRFHGPPDETGTVEIGYSVVEQYHGRAPSR